MMPRCCWAITLLACTVAARAQQPASEGPKAPTPVDNVKSLSARQAVREGNERLLEGDADAALEAYTHARELRPDAPQIPFVEGLAELDRKDYDAARDLFREAAASKNDELSAEAQYALGAAHHLQALETKDPQQAIEHLEAAMDKYREVLARKPDYELARESDYKAASMRRRLKELLQQQKQQQQQQNQDGEKQKDKQNQDQQQSNSQDQQDSDQQEQQEQSQSEQQQSEDQQQQQSADQKQNEKEDQSQQQQSESKEQQNESEEQKEAQASQKEEDVSREQAERRLREMMQAIRDKQKHRRQKVRKVPLPPVEKDW